LLDRRIGKPIRPAKAGNPVAGFVLPPLTIKIMTGEEFGILDIRFLFWLLVWLVGIGIVALIIWVKGKFKK